MRGKVFYHRDRLKAIFRFADHFNIVFEFQYLSKFPAHDPVVVRQQDTDSFHGYCCKTNIGAQLKSMCVSCLTLSMG